ncbi:MAG: hypothetical protein IKR48_02735 [Kiritimatiellae bacterium]|nr:hypothetical protein [Kiritimatiellia bacterium]
MTKKSRFLLASWKGIRESVAYRVGAMAIILSLLAGSSLAGTATWNGGDGSWTDTTKWTGDCANGYPSSGDTAVFNSAAGGTVEIPSGGITCSVLSPTSGAWTFTGGKLTLSANTPFAFQQTDMITFDCPIYFSNTGEKIVYGGKTYRNVVSAAGNGRVFLRGDTGATPLQRTIIFTGSNCQCDLTTVANVAAGSNANTEPTSALMTVTDGASIRAKIFFVFAYSSLTISNGGKIETTNSNTSQSFDIVGWGCSLKVLSGSTLKINGKFDLGQGKTNPVLTSVLVDDASITANYLTVTVPMDKILFTLSKSSGAMGSLTVASYGAIKDSVPFAIQLTDSSAFDWNTTYPALVTETANTKTADFYAMSFNGIAPVTPTVTDGILSYSPMANALVWTGNEGDGKFSSAGNWSGNVAPTGGEDLVFENITTATSIENDLQDYSPRTITVKGTCTAPLTFIGNALTNVNTIFNQAAIVPVFSCPVTFAEKINLACLSSNVEFAGGVTGTVPGKLCNLAYTLQGKYTLTQSSDANTSWAPVYNESFIVPSGSELTIPGTNYFSLSKTMFEINTGGVMNVGTLRIADNNGHFLVNGILNVDHFWNNSAASCPIIEGSTGTLNTLKIGLGSNSPTVLRIARINLGAGGIAEDEGSAGSQSYLDAQNGTVFGATDDWTFAGRVQSANYGLNVNGTVTLDTADATDGTTPRTITLQSTVTGTGTLAVTGTGTLDLSSYGGVFSLASGFAPAAGVTLKLSALATLDGTLTLPATGTVNLGLLSSDGIPRGSVLTLFSHTGLAATNNLAALDVSVIGDDSVAGIVSVNDAGEVLYTVTESDAEPLSLLWRPVNEETWSTSVAAWQKVGDATPVAFAAYADARFDGEDSGLGSILIGAPITVGGITVTGNKSYTLTGTGIINGSDTFVMGGSGTLTFDGPELTYQTILITNGIVKLGANTGTNAFGHANSSITIRDKGALDVNHLGYDFYPNEATHCKRLYIEGAGPDGEGVLRNSQADPANTTTFSEIYLTGDATIGGPGRLDVRYLPYSELGTVASDLRFSGPDTATLTVKGQVSGTVHGFDLVNVPNVSVGRIVIDNGMLTIEGVTNPRVPNGIIVKNGGDMRGYNLSQPLEPDVTVGEGNGKLTCSYGSMTVNGKVTVPEGLTLTMTGNITLAGGIENHGTVVVASGTVQITGERTGNGIFSGMTWNGTTLSSGEEINLAGTTKFAESGMIVTGGTVNVQGTLDSAIQDQVLADFVSGTLRLTGDLTTTYYRPVGGFGESEAGTVTIDLNGHTFTSLTGLDGFSDVTLTGNGKVVSDASAQGQLSGLWTVNSTVTDTVDLSGSSALIGGLSLGENTTVKLDITSESVVEMAVYKGDWAKTKAYRGDYCFRVNTLQRLHSYLANNTSVSLASVGYVFRGQFYVDEEQAGMWYFGGTFDDRILLIIDGQSILETTASSEVKSGSAELNEGWHTFYIYAWDNTGQQGATVSGWKQNMALGWSTTEPSAPLVAASYTRFDTTTLKIRPIPYVGNWYHKNGFSSAWRTLSDWEFSSPTNTLEALTFYAGDENPWTPFNSCVNRFTGYIYVTPEQAGTWSVHLAYDDMISLTIAGQTIAAPDKVADGTLTLAAGVYPYEVRTADNTGHYGPNGNIGHSVSITLPGATSAVDFNEENFKLQVTKLMPSGIYGETTLAAGSVLTNAASGADSYCPIYGALTGTGSLSGNFRFLGGTLVVTGDGASYELPSLGTAPRADTLSELGGITCRFTRRPARKTYVLCDAYGLTEESVRDLPVTVEINGVYDATFSEALVATIENGKLVLKNSRSPGIIIFVK